MEIKLLEHTKLSNIVIGARTCYDSFHKGGNYDTPTDDITEKDKSLIDTLINTLSHKSVSEHCIYVFNIKGISRLCLQELARHRLASYSVKSTRYTLSQLAKDEHFSITETGMANKQNLQRATKYINLTGNELVDSCAVSSLSNLQVALKDGIKNDIAKYCLPECWKVDLVWTINIRSLMNFLELRLSNSAHFEIRELAKNILNTLPKEHRFLYSKYIDKITKLQKVFEQYK